MKNPNLFHRLIAFLPSCLLALTCSATIPEGYYSSADGKTGDAICAALHEKIKGHTSLGYDNLYVMYQTSDMTSQGYIWDMYSTCNFSNPGDKCGSYKRVCDCFNREHSVPASWFGDANPMYCDPFHVIPTDGYVNNQRSNYALGECANGERLSGGSLCKLGTSTFEGFTGVGKVFEVDDQYKGDFARAYFYMVTCYRDKNFTQAGGGSTMFTWSNSKAGFTPYTIALMLKWHRNDPVSEKEIRRNDAIYVRQGNRNPFIDYPCLAEYIWGKYKTTQLDLSSLLASSDETFSTTDRSGCDCQTDKPSITAPKFSTFDVGSASVNEAISQDIFVQGANLTQPLTFALSGTNAAYFSLEKTSITAAEANKGYSLTITYQPQATTTTHHTAKLTISSTEIKTAREVELTGECRAELVTPVTGTTFNFASNGVKDVATQVVHVKGTNLTSNLYIGISKDGAGIFSVTPTSLTAAQANAGADLTVTYTPKAIGINTANLIVNSMGKEFTQPTLPLSGICAFRLQPVTNLSSSSATLNWVDAGVNDYLVDVFFLNQEEIPEVEVLNSVAGSKTSSQSGTYTDVKDYVRLGSSSAIGKIQYDNLDLSKAGKVTVVAKSYKTDSSVKIRVCINNVCDTFALTSSDQTFTVSFDAGLSSSSSILITNLDKGQRALIKTVIATTGGTKEIRTSLAGYPRHENYLSHTVTDLSPETEYSYTVTPDGLPSSPIEKFITDAPATSLDETSSSESSGYKSIDDAGNMRLHYGRHTYSATGAIIR